MTPELIRKNRLGLSELYQKDINAKTTRNLPQLASVRPPFISTIEKEGRVQGVVL